MECGKVMLLGLVVLGSIQIVASFLPGPPLYPFPTTKKPLHISKEMKKNGVVVYNLGSGVIQSVPDEFEFTGTSRCTLFGLGLNWSGLPVVIPYLVAAICGELDADVNPQVGVDCFPQFYSFVRPSKFSCPPFVNGDLPNPDNCAYYYRCIPDYRDPIPQACGDGTLFNTNYNPADYRTYCVHWNAPNTCFRS